MHKHIEWDDPGANSVKAHYAGDPNQYSAPHPGMILSARYQNAIVRIRVQAYKDDTSIGEVAALIDSASQKRMDSLGGLSVGDIVRLPDDKRAFEPKEMDSKEDH